MKKRILLVEDDEAIRLAVAELLREEGYAVEECEDGGEGFLAARAQRFDGLILDMMMPSLDGHAMLIKLFEDGAPRPATIIMSALSRDEAYERLGCKPPFVHKPFARDELLLVVQHFVGAAEKED